MKLTSAIGDSPKVWVVYRGSCGSTVIWSRMIREDFYATRALAVKAAKEMGKADPYNFYGVGSAMLKLDFMRDGWGDLKAVVGPEKRRVEVAWGE